MFFIQSTVIFKKSEMIAINFQFELKERILFPKLHIRMIANWKILIHYHYFLVNDII